MRFDEFVRSHGLRPRSIQPDGRIHRCGTESHPRSRNGAYFLAPEGDFGWVQDWSTMPEPVHWHADQENGDAAPQYDPARMRQRRQELERERRVATAEAIEFYSSCPPLRGGHPYLEDHDLDMTGCRGLRIDEDGWIVVPAQRGGRIQTLQRIAPDGEKRFWPGAPAKGASYMIRRDDSTVTVLVEGLATGLALYAAIPESSVLVAFNTGNLSDQAVLRRVPEGLCVVAADNDWETKERIGSNPGIDAARAAAELLGCGAAVPEGIEGTDWADLRQEWLAERLERRTKHETTSQVRQGVDGRIRMAVMRHAKLRRENV